ncbi:MAG TPA: hypothetical protein ENH91_07540 [Leeuwenhoekiella sp.]|nr:hypothetical protein [Leeuwenhoekiella sp.]
MQTAYNKLLLLVALVLLCAGCSRKNDSFLSRNYHAVSAKYNTLYNGEVAFKEGRGALIDSYRDNFWEILPIEQLEQFDEISLPGEAKNPNFERAEEKAVKAIQKHSMEINGEERNPKIDEAFMLLGKARYYDQRFVRALESFNYILSFYPASNNIAQAKIWKAKTNIRLSNDVVALENLHKLLEEEQELKDQDYADASAMLAQGYININRKDSALVYIDKAATLTRKNEERGRYLFIEGQIYDAIGEAGLANETYTKVIDLNRKSPRRYMINAYIARARNFDYEHEDRVAFLEMLQELAENRENRPFLDRIYNQLGEYYLNIEETDTAIAYYNRSLRTPGEDKYLKSRDYLTLGNISFDSAYYQQAGAYYDSTLVNLNDRTREYRDINKKRENLTDVIRFEQVAKKNDSILSLVAMSDTERRTYFEDYIAKLKEKAAKDSIAAAASTAGIRNNEFFNAEPGISGPQTGEFYFYNATTVAQGKLNFEGRWGNRELADNWRLSSMLSSGNADTAITQSDAAIPGADTRYDLDQYLTSIPTAPGKIDTLARDRNFAYYQLGLIYKEKFKEYALAAERLEKLLEQNPEERLILPAKYHLYQIYGNAGNRAKQQQYRDDILSNHSDSRYAAFIKNPEKALDKEADSPEMLYNALYRRFEQQEYAHVINQADTYIDQFVGDPFVPKFELLKATAIGRLQGFEEYKQALNYVALNYPNEEEGKKAQQTLDEVIPQIQDSAFAPDNEAESWKLVYSFPTEEENFTKKREELQHALNVYFYTQYYISVDVYTNDERLLVIHGFTSKDAAERFAYKLENDSDFNWDTPATPMSSKNYRTIQLHKNLNSYLTRDSK